MFRSLEVPLFRLLWYSSLFAMAAMQMNIVARSWLAYDMTGSALALALVAGARGIPQLFLSIFGGVAADRISKRTLLLASQICLGLLSLLNAVLVHAGVIQIWHLVAIGVGQGAVFAFNMPARQAFIPELAGPRLLPNAIAVNSTGMNLNRVLAPAIGGVMIAFSPVLTFYAIAAFYVGGVMMVLRLPAGLPALVHKESALEDMKIGLRYIWNHDVLKILMAMAFIPTFLGMPFQHLLPVFQADVFSVGPSELGFMYTAVGMGSLTSAVTMTYLSQHSRKGLMQVMAGIGFGLGLVMFALAPAYGLALIFLFLVGAFSQGYQTINQILILANTDAEFFGRVSSIRMMTWSLTPVALLVLGVFIDLFGAPVTVAVQGIILSVFIIAMAARNPRVWHGGKGSTDAAATAHRSHGPGAVH